MDSYILQILRAERIQSGLWHDSDQPDLLKIRPCFTEPVVFVEVSPVLLPYSKGHHLCGWKRVDYLPSIEHFFF